MSPAVFNTEDVQLCPSKLPCGVEASNIESTKLSQSQLLGRNVSLREMVSLPSRHSPKELELLQFYLVYGRRMQLGTSATPRYDPSIDVMQNLIEVSPLYSLVHIVISQHLLSKIMQRGIPETSYKYQAEAYRVVNERIGDASMPINIRIFELIQLTMLEYSLGRHKQSLLHLEALENFVESQGGLQIFLDPCDSRALRMEPRFYMGMFLRVHQVPSRSYTALQAGLGRLSDYYGRIRKWLVIQRHHFFQTSSTSVGLSARTAASSALLPLQNYLEGLVHDSDHTRTLSKGAPFATQAYIASLMICVTLVEHDVSGQESAELLQEIQTCLEGSCDSKNDMNKPLISLFVGATVNTVSYVRRNRFPMRCMEELKICEVGIDALKCYRLLDPITEGVFSEKLRKCVFSSVEECAEDLLTPEFVHEMHDVVRSNWFAND